MDISSAGRIEPYQEEASLVGRYRTHHLAIERRKNEAYNAANHHDIAKRSDLWVPTADNQGIEHNT